jgi:predicted nucleotidyltransferase
VFVNEKELYFTQDPKIVRRVFMRKLHESQIPALTEDEKRAISIFKKKIRKALSLRKLILFGSKARGDYTEDSDVDLMLLVEEPYSSDLRKNVSDLEWESIMEVDAPLTSKVYNYHDWVNNNNIWTPLKDNIIKEGIEIEL